MHRLIAVLGLAVLAAACGASSSPPSPDAGDAGGSQLTGGGTVVGEGGVQLIATAGAVSDPVTVRITAAAAPAQPLPAETTPLGAFYSLASDRALRVPAGDALVLGLPVPAGADTAHLVAMALVSTAELVNATGPARDVWLPLAGRFDASRQVFFTTMQALSVAGHTFTLAARPDVSSASAAPPPARDRSATDVTMLGHDFHVGCLGYAHHACPGTSQDDMAHELAFARLAMLGHGFPEPRLALDVASVDPAQHHVVANGYDVWLADDTSDYCKVENTSVDGVYHPDLAQLFVCLPADATSLGTYGPTADHEYFHALQYTSTKLYDAWSSGTIEQFLLEGSAEVGGGSVHVAVPTRDSDFAMHPLDIEMRSTEDDEEYRAQDLWVYIGRRAGQGIQYLIPIFEAGGTIDAIDPNLPGGDLHKLYFDYVTNNVFEGPETYDGQLHPECQIDPSTFRDVIAAWKQPAPPPEGDLPPLSARAYNLQWIDPLPNVRVENVAGDPDLHYKIYKQNDCGPVPEGARQINPADGGFYYIVLANTGFTASAHYKLQIR